MNAWNYTPISHTHLHGVGLGKMKNLYRILVRKPEGKRSFRRSRHRCEDNIKMDLREIGWEVVDWSHLSQDRDQWQAPVSMAMNLQVT
jgi:hypothetical protein